MNITPLLELYFYYNLSETNYEKHPTFPWITALKLHVLHIRVLLYYKCLEIESYITITKNLNSTTTSLSSFKVPLWCFCPLLLVGSKFFLMLPCRIAISPAVFLTANISLILQNSLCLEPSLLVCKEAYQGNFSQHRVSSLRAMLIPIVKIL